MGYLARPEVVIVSDIEDGFMGCLRAPFLRNNIRFIDRIVSCIEFKIGLDLIYKCLKHRYFKLKRNMLTYFFIYKKILFNFFLHKGIFSYYFIPNIISRI